MLAVLAVQEPAHPFHEGKGLKDLPQANALYVAQILPFLGNVVELEWITRTFLRRGRLEKLTYVELFNEKQGAWDYPV